MIEICIIMEILTQLSLKYSPLIFYDFDAMAYL